MKNSFTKEEMIKGKGCYSLKQLMALPFMEKEKITLEDVLRSSISLHDKRWMVWNNCELSLKEKKKLALQLVWMVLPIYEEKYPGDLRVRECLEALESFNKGSITEEELKEKRRAADAAAAYVTAANAAAAAAADVTAANAAAAAADAAAAYVTAATAANAAYAAYAAAARNDLTYQEKYVQILIDFVK